jgi:aspartate kinase
MNPIVVLKFGGASVASPFDFDRVAEIVKSKVQEGNKIVVVVSAMLKSTDQLIDMAHLVHPNPPKRELDMLVSVGERISIALLAMSLDKIGIEAISLTGSQSGVITSIHHTEALIIDVKPSRVRKLLELNKVVIVAGFQGVSKDGDITTLGRGGSDTSAVALAIALGSSKVEFFKEVQGIYDKDPLKHQEAKFYPSLNYDSMIELCKNGAKVLHERAVSLAKKNGIVLEIKSFKNRNLPFTTIKESLSELVFKNSPCYEESI